MADSAPQDPHTNWLFRTVCDTSREWEKPVAPPLDDPSWQTLFEQGDSRQKRNAARAWLWALSQSPECPASRASWWQLRDIFEKHKDWLQQIEPYLDADCFTEEQLGAVASFLQQFFGKEPWQKRTIEHALWFGTPEEKQQHMQMLVNDHDYFDVVVNLRSVHGRVWDLALADTAPTAYPYVAAQLSALAGLRRVEGLTEGCREQKGWYHLGRLGAYSRSLCGNLDLQAEFRQAHDFVQQQPGHIAVAAFTRLCQYSIEKEYGSPCLVYTSVDNRDDDLHPGNVYNVLSHWLPAYHTQWVLAQELQLDLSAAADMILAQLRPRQPRAAVLPGDLTHTIGA